MNLPPILKGESLTRLLQGAAGGAVVAMILGFGWGGWQLGSTAEKAAAEVLALPVYPELTEEQIHYVAAKVKEFPT